MYSITYQRDEAGVVSVTCSCGWTFTGKRVNSEIPAVFKRPSSLEFDTAVRDHEYRHERDSDNGVV